MTGMGYKGISFPFRIGAKGGVVMSTATEMELAHIKESIRQILLTRQGERVNEPTFGAGLYNLVFESLDSSLINLIAFTVQEALQIWEPRIEVLNVDVFEVEGGIGITVDFQVVRSLLQDSTTIVIEREAA